MATTTKKKATITTPGPRPTKIATPTATTASTAPAAPAAPAAGSEAAYEQYLPSAEALPAASVASFHGDPSIAYANVLTGTASVLAAKPPVGGLFTSADLAAIESLPQVALGLLFASLQAQTKPGKNVTLDANQKEAQGLRKVLLSSAIALSAAGLVDGATVAAIQVGRGPLDAAKDLISLSALFRANPAAAAKSPVTAVQIARAAVLGSELQSQLLAKSAPKKKTVSTAADTRDRFWTLVTQAYDRLWRVGAMLFGEAELPSKVPALLAVARKKTVASKAKAAAKTAADATAKAAKAATRAASVKPKPVKKPKKRK